jgi:hypothetical protein
MDGTAELIAEAICNEAAGNQDCDTNYSVLVQKEMVPLIEAALGMRRVLECEVYRILWCGNPAYKNSPSRWCEPCLARGPFDAILEKLGCSDDN